MEKATFPTEHCTTTADAVPTGTRWLALSTSAQGIRVLTESDNQADAVHVADLYYTHLTPWEIRDTMVTVALVDESYDETGDILDVVWMDGKDKADISKGAEI